MLDEIVVVYAIVEDLLKAIGHQEDCRIQMSDAEVITAALVAARFFNGNQFLAFDALPDESGQIPSSQIKLTPPSLRSTT